MSTCLKHDSWAVLRHDDSKAVDPYSTAALRSAALGATTAGTGPNDFVGAAIRAGDPHEGTAKGGLNAVMTDTRSR